MQVLIGKQTQKGRAMKTGLKVLSFTNFGLKPNVETTTSKAINSIGFEKGSWVSKINTSGDITVESNLGQLELFIQSAGFKAGTDAEANKYKADNLFDKYLTVVLDDDEAESHEVYQDCLINTLKLDTSLASYVNATVGLIGMDFEVQGTKFNSAGAVEFEGNPLICLGATITENGNRDNTASIDSLEINLNNSLEGKGALNSVYNKSIKRNGLRDIKINFTYNEFDKVGYVEAHTKLKENSTYEVKVVLKEVETNKKIEFLFPKCKVANIERTNIESNPGMSKELKAGYDATLKTPVVITITK